LEQTPQVNQQMRDYSSHLSNKSAATTQAMEIQKSI